MKPESYPYLYVFRGACWLVQCLPFVAFPVRSDARRSVFRLRLPGPGPGPPSVHEGSGDAPLPATSRRLSGDRPVRRFRRGRTGSRQSRSTNSRRWSDRGPRRVRDGADRRSEDDASSGATRWTAPSNRVDPTSPADAIRTVDISSVSTPEPVARRPVPTLFEYTIITHHGYYFGCHMCAAGGLTVAATE